MVKRVQYKCCMPDFKNLCHETQNTQSYVYALK